MVHVHKCVYTRSHDEGRSHDDDNGGMARREVFACVCVCACFVKTKTTTKNDPQRLARELTLTKWYTRRDRCRRQCVVVNFVCLFAARPIDSVSDS